MFIDIHSLRRITAICMSVLMVLTLVVSSQAQCTWAQQGPGVTTKGQVEGITEKPVVGSIQTVATHPTDPATIYVGAVNGGIWKTTNATSLNPTWVEQLGTNSSLSMGAIAFDPTDCSNQTLMAGAGRYSSFGGRGNDRIGVWRTTNGTSWTLLNGGGALTDLNITGVAPRDATLVIAADDMGAGAGVWRSTNTGAGWTRISGAAGTKLPLGASFDLAGDPTNNARLFTNAGSHGIYRSVDTGATWTKVSNPEMDAILNFGVRNVKISVGTSNNVYVAIVDDSNELAGLFRSGDGGTTWTALDLPITIEDGVAVGIHPAALGPLYISIAAHLTNADVVFIGGDRQPDRKSPQFPNSIGARDFSGRLFRVDASRPPGKQTSHITHSHTTSNSSPHADSRDMAMDAAGNLIETDDGGIYKRTTPLQNTGDWASLIGNLRTTEFYAIAWDSNSRTVIGGAQDTGIPQQTATSNFVWESVHTGDGGDVAVNDTGTPGTSVRFSSSQGLGNFLRQTCDASNHCKDKETIPLNVVSGSRLRKQWFTPFEVNNANPNRLVVGGDNSVYESMDEGNTLVEIGIDITANSAGQHTMAYGAKGNPDMLYVGAGNQLFVRRAAAPSPLTRSPTYPGAATNRDVEGVTINSSNPQNAIVVDKTTVYRTVDAGLSWTNITGNLLTLAPGALRAVAVSTSNPESSVIVGTDNGVFIARGPAFTNWIALGTNLPRAAVYDLEYDPADEVLAAGLLGRGAWTINLREVTPGTPVCTMAP